MPVCPPHLPHPSSCPPCVIRGTRWNFNAHCLKVLSISEEIKTTGNVILMFSRAYVNFASLRPHASNKNILHFKCVNSLSLSLLIRKRRLCTFQSGCNSTESADTHCIVFFPLCFYFHHVFYSRLRAAFSDVSIYLWETVPCTSLEDLFVPLWAPICASDSMLHQITTDLFISKLGKCYISSWR